MALVLSKKTLLILLFLHVMLNLSPFICCDYYSVFEKGIIIRTLL